MPMNKERRSKPTNQPHIFCFIELICKGPVTIVTPGGLLITKFVKNALIIQNCLGGGGGGREQWHKRF